MLDRMNNILSMFYRINCKIYICRNNRLNNVKFSCVLIYGLCECAQYISWKLYTFFSMFEITVLMVVLEEQSGGHKHWCILQTTCEGKSVYACSAWPNLKSGRKACYSVIEAREEINFKWG